MELTTILNEPAVIGTGLVLAALYTIWHATGMATESFSLQSLWQRELWQLVAVYVLLAAAVGGVIYAIRAYNVPVLPAFAVLYIAVSASALQRYAVGDSASTTVVRQLVWQLLVVGVAGSLLWWWPW